MQIFTNKIVQIPSFSALFLTKSRYFGLIVLIISRNYQHTSVIGDMFDKFPIKTRLGECRGIAQDDEFHASTCNGYIHAAQVVKESDATFVISSYHRNQDHITFLALESIYGIDRDVGKELFQFLLLPDKATEQLHLAFIGRDNTEIHAFGQ